MKSLPQLQPIDLNYQDVAMHSSKVELQTCLDAGADVLDVKLPAVKTTLSFASVAAPLLTLETMPAVSLQG